MADFDPHAPFDIERPAASGFDPHAPFEIDDWITPGAQRPADGGLDDWQVPTAPQVQREAIGLGRRFVENFRDAQRNSLHGARDEAVEQGRAFVQAGGSVAPTGDALAAAEAARQQAAQEQRQRRADFEAMPGWSGLFEGAAALSGQLAGGALSPENMVAGIFRPAAGPVGRIVRQGVESGIGNLVTDPAVQGAQVVMGTRDAYDPMQTALAGVLGFGIGAGFAGAPELARTVRERLAARRGVAPEAVDPATVTQADIESVLTDRDALAVAQANGITDPEDPRLGLLAGRLAERRAAEAERAQVAPSVTATDLRTAREAVEAGADPSTVQPPARPPVAVVEVGPSGQAVPLQPDGTMAPETRSINEGIRGRARPEGYGALVPVEPQPNRMTPGEIARARAQMEGGNPNTAEPPPRMVAPEGRAPQTPDQVAEQRGAAEAFRLAEAQRQRMTDPGIRDTQPAGAALGAGDAASPRMAQDFAARAQSPAGDRIGLPEQTYRYTERDPNAEFPGAERGTGPEGGRGRTPFPDQGEVVPPGRVAHGDVPPGRGPVIDGVAEDITPPCQASGRRRAASGRRARRRNPAHVAAAAYRRGSEAAGTAGARGAPARGGRSRGCPARSGRWTGCASRPD